MKLNFSINIEKDTDNWHGSIDYQAYGVNFGGFQPKGIAVEKMKDHDYLRGYLEEKYYAAGKIAEFKTWLEEHVNTAEIKNDLERLMGKKFGDEAIEVFITVFGRGMYYVPGNFFFLNYCHRDPMKSIPRIYHELMHFLFHRYYWEECQKAGLSEPQIHDLKESLTVLLNPILEKRGLSAFLDQGYPKHQELRAKLKTIWEEGNYDEKGFEPFF